MCPSTFQKNFDPLSRRTGEVVGRPIRRRHYLAGLDLDVEPKFDTFPLPNNCTTRPSVCSPTVGLAYESPLGRVHIAHSQRHVEGSAGVSRSKDRARNPTDR